LFDLIGPGYLLVDLVYEETIVWLKNRAECDCVADLLLGFRYGVCSYYVFIRCEPILIYVVRIHSFWAYLHQKLASKFLRNDSILRHVDQLARTRRKLKVRFREDNQIFNVAKGVCKLIILYV